MSKSRPVLPRLLGLVLVLVLLVAMVANTKFLTPKEVAAAGPKRFDPEATAASLFKKAQAEIPARATPVATLVPALQKDVKGAQSQFKPASPTEGTLLFRATATGTVIGETAGNISLRVQGVGKQTPVLVPTSTAVNGTALRDALGFRFGSAPNQTAFQGVGDELKKLMSSAVQSAAPKRGSKITVIGLVNEPDTSGPVPAAKPVIIQPVVVQGAS